MHTKKNISYTLSKVIVEHLFGAWRNSQFIQSLCCVKRMVVNAPDFHEAWESPYLFRRS